MRFLEWLAVREKLPLIQVPSPLSAPVQAVINIGPHNLPPGISASLGIATVKHALHAMSGAEWINVRHSPPGVDVTAEVFQTGTFGPESYAIRDWLENLVMASLALLARPLVTPTVASERDEAACGAVETASSPPQSVPIAMSHESTIDMQISEANSAGEGAVSPLRADDGDLRSLCEAELLGRLLSRVGMVDSAKLADQATARFGGFAPLVRAPEMELRNVPGFGARFVAAIKRIHAAALRLSRPAQPRLDGEMERITYLSKDPAQGTVGHFRVLYLDAAGRLRSDGTQAGAPLSRKPILPRSIVMRALDLKASSILLLHSLRDGNVSPSDDSMRLMSMIQDAGEALGLSVKVHVTIENGRWPHFPDRRYPRADLREAVEVAANDQDALAGTMRSNGLS